MIFIFDSNKVVSRLDFDVELLLHFEDKEDFVSYMKENFEVEEGFDAPQIDICGIKIQDAENGILKNKNGDYPEEVIIVNTDFETRMEDPLYMSFYKPYLDYITTYNRDKSIDNLLDND